MSLSTVETCQHSPIQTEDFMVCSRCGRVLDQLYSPGRTADHTQKRGEKNQLEVLLRDVGENNNISETVILRSFELLKKPSVMNLLTKRRKVTTGMKNIEVCVHVLFLSFLDEGVPRDMREVWQMFGFYDRAKNMWRHDVTLAGAVPKFAQTPPSFHLRYLSGYSGISFTTIRRKEKNKWNFFLKSVDKFYEGSCRAPRSIMATALMLLVEKAELKRSLLRAAAVSKSSINRLRSELRHSLLKQIGDKEKLGTLLKSLRI